jgi:hypothetical protein
MIRVIGLVFAAALVACAAGREVRVQDTGGESSAPDTLPPAVVVVDGADTLSPSEAEPIHTDTLAPTLPADGVVVYYFHLTFRCDTCLKFEAYADEALRAAFPDELASGALEWHVVNIDDEENAHYEDDYDLTEISLIVSEVRDGRVVDWRILGAIWGLVQDKDIFMSYVENEVASSLERLEERGLTGGSSGTETTPADPPAR